MNLQKSYHLLLLSIVLYFVCVVLFSIYRYQSSAEKKRLEIDNYIYSVAASLPYYLDNNSIDKLANGKMTEEEYDSLVFTVSDLARVWGVDYIYQMRVVDNQIYNVFTSGNTAELKNKTYQRYNEKYPNEIKEMLAAVEEHKTKYDSDSDDWGSYRSVYVPVLQKNGEYHIIGVDYSLNQLDEALHNEAITSFIYGFLVLIFSFPFLFITYVSLHKIILELDKNFKNLSDITTEYKQLSFLDQTTQMPNRRSFLENAKREINRLKRTEGNLFLAMLDLDHFKNVNDTYGHNNGDIVLTSFGKLVQDSLRLEDIWGRWGGEEFVVMLPHKDMDGVTTIMERIRSLCENNEITLSDGQKLFITVSIGISHVNINRNAILSLFDIDRTLMNAIDRADKQLYIAKDTGRNRICCEEDNSH